ncbi:hypothetical protein L211DRAFT_850510 [Terfezia boudieri ATCC MYA-4762]|uniref:Uncharacterized protein n=1 Tax=Terfezia boudieri ATCC MYA-4762 TaxID=1051890 RepID=A0A3N4LHT9_9PEZI|nr:hypothetical protein L211DRAFT_850510 [Terfezia boudieri ATCC MYA-4762]
MTSRIPLRRTSMSAVTADTASPTCRTSSLNPETRMKQHQVRHQESTDSIGNRIVTPRVPGRVQRQMLTRTVGQTPNSPNPFNAHQNVNGKTIGKQGLRSTNPSPEGSSTQLVPSSVPVPIRPLRHTHFNIHHPHRSSISAKAVVAGVQGYHNNSTECRIPVPSTPRLVKCHVGLGSGIVATKQTQGTGRRGANVACPVAPSNTQSPGVGPQLPAPNNAGTYVITEPIGTNCKAAVAVNTERPQPAGKENNTAIRADTGSLEEYLAVETYFRCTAVQTGPLKAAHRNKAVKTLLKVIAGHIPTATDVALSQDSAGRKFKNLETMMSATNTLAVLTEKVEQLEIGTEVKNVLDEGLTNLSHALIELFEVSSAPYRQNSEGVA